MIFLISLLIIFVAVLTFLKSEIHNLDSEQILNKSSFLFPVSFVITMAFIGLIGNTSYYLNISINSSIYFTYLIGILLLPIIWKKRNFINFPKFQKIELKNSKILLLALMIYIVFLFLYRALAPWSDGDEITQYGYRTKLIALGFTFSDNIASGFPQFAESLYAYFYFISKTTILPKIFKVIGLFFVSQLVYYLTFHFTKNEIYALLASICFILAPELRYLGSSLKVDNVTMLFEFTSLVICIMVFYEKNNFAFKTIILLCIIAIFVASIAVAVRPSAIYTLIISLYVSIHLLLLKKNAAIPFFIGGFFLLFFIIFCGYWINLYLYHNPLYPMGGFWVNLIPNAEYLEAWTISHMREVCNIFLDNKLLEYLYVSAYMSFGFGTTIYDHISQIIWPDLISQIIHPIYKGYALEWGHPILVSMFVLPVFLNENRKLFFPLLLYFILYTFWFLGIHFSRVFLAAQALAVCCVFIGTAKKNKSDLLNILRILFFNYIGLIVILLTIYHTLYVFYRMPNSIGTFYSKEKAYESNIQYYQEMINSGTNYEPFPFKYSEVKIINDILEGYPKVFVFSDINGPIHIFFDHGFFCPLNIIGFREQCMSNVKLQSSLSIRDNVDCILNKTLPQKYMEENYIIESYLDEYKLWCKKNNK